MLDFIDSMRFNVQMDERVDQNSLHPPIICFDDITTVT